MLKKYIKPEINMVMFEAENVIQTSSITVQTTPKSFEGAVQVENQTIDIFGE